MLEYAHSTREPLRAPEPASCRFAHQLLEQSNGRLDASDVEVSSATELARGGSTGAMPAVDTMAAPLPSTAARPGTKEQPGADPQPAKGVPVYVMLPLDTVRTPPTMNCLPVAVRRDTAIGVPSGSFVQGWFRDLVLSARQRLTSSLLCHSRWTQTAASATGPPSGSPARWRRSRPPGCMAWPSMSGCAALAAPPPCMLNSLPWGAPGRPHSPQSLRAPQRFTDPGMQSAFSSAAPGRSAGLHVVHG